MWSLRITHELPYWTRSCFATITYDDEHLPVNMGKTETNSLYPPDLTNFWKKIRKNTNTNFKYYACGEYGDESERPHYHAIIFGLDKRDHQLLYDNWQMCDPLRLQLSGVTMKRINYVTSYVIKKIDGLKGKKLYKDREKPFLRCSQGIGWRWAEKYMSRLLRDEYITRDGKRVPIPKYYRDKIHMEKISTTHPEYLKPEYDGYDLHFDPELKKECQNWLKELEQAELRLRTQYNIRSRKGGANKV